MDELLATELVRDLRALIDGARSRVATTANRELTLLYWRVGDRIRTEVLGEERAGYGKEIVAAYGRGFEKSNLHRMVKFAGLFPDEQIVVTLSPQLSWSHFIAILPVKEPLARDYYAEMCRLERWNVRTLRKKIGGMLFERTALSKKPEALIRQELDVEATIKDYLIVRTEGMSKTPVAKRKFTSFLRRSNPLKTLVLRCDGPFFKKWGRGRAMCRPLIAQVNTSKTIKRKRECTRVVMTISGVRRFGSAQGTTPTILYFQFKKGVQMAQEFQS